MTIAPPPASFVYGTFWSNDGSSVAGSQPSSGVALPVQQGLFNVFLGDTNLVNMMPITPPVFSQSDVYLRIWFSDGVSAYTQLAPDQRLGSVGYAMTAAQLAGPVASANGGPTVFNAGGTEAMRITTTGNVGIGVTNPPSPLTVSGQIRAQALAPAFEGLRTARSLRLVGRQAAVEVGCARASGRIQAVARRVAY